MLLLWDFIRRTFYLCLFIIPIPIGAYTIHNGSSALTALFSYIILSLVIPILYLRSKKSGFGILKRPISPILYIVGLILVHSITGIAFWLVHITFLWALPTIGRDFVFIIVMYLQVLVALLIGYVLSRILYRV